MLNKEKKNIITLHNKNKRSRTRWTKEKCELLISFVYLLFSTSVLFCRTLSLRYLLNKLLPRNLLAIWIRAKWQRNSFHFIAIIFHVFIFSLLCFALLAVRTNFVVLMALNVSLFSFDCIRLNLWVLICVCYMKNWLQQIKILINGKSNESKQDWM